MLFSDCQITRKTKIGLEHCGIMFLHPLKRESSMRMYRLVVNGESMPHVVGVTDGVDLAEMTRMTRDAANEMAETEEWFGDIINDGFVKISFEEVS